MINYNKYNIYEHDDFNLIVERVLLKRNLANGHRLAIAVILIQIAMIIITEVLVLTDSINTNINYNYYIVGYIFQLIVSFFFFIYTKKHKDDSHSNLKLLRRSTYILYAYIAIFLMWGNYTTTLEQFTNNNIFGYLLTVVALSVIFMFKPQIHVSINTISCIALAILLVIFQPDASVRIVNIINVALFMVFLMISNYSAYQGFIQSEKYKQEVLALSKDFKNLSEIDELTGLANRRAMRDYIHDFIVHSKENLQVFGVAFIDIDYFKNYNDRYGHIKGDRALKLIGKTLSEFNQYHRVTAYRYGGEEFVILFFNVERDEIADTLKQLTNQIHELNIIHEDSNVSNHVTTSIGYYLSTLNDETISDCIQKADTALLRAKELGRNRTIRFSADLRIKT